MAPHTTAATSVPDRPIKILMLHGYTQSGPTFQAKTGALRKTLQKSFPQGIELVYPTAPIRITAAEESFLGRMDSAGAAAGTGTEGQEQDIIEAWGWWRRTTDNGQAYAYQGIEQGLDLLAELLKTQGPFDGVIGFSQGAACAAMLAALLEPGRKHAFQAQEKCRAGMPFPKAFEGGIQAPLKFAVSYSGFRPTGQNPYLAFYEPKISTPILHFLGMQDVVVDEARSLALVNACVHSDEKYIVRHPGGHFLPSTQKASVYALIGFIKDVLHREEAGREEEQTVQDMHVPF